MQIPIVWKMPNIGPPMNWALMYVTVGEERNQTWNPRERPVKGWLFRMVLNHIGSRGGSVVEWCAWSRWASLQEMADPNLFSSGLIPIHNCRYWYGFRYKGSFYLNIIIIFVGIVFKVSSCGWYKPHSTKKKKYTNSLNLNVSQRNVFMLGFTFKQVAATAVMFSFNIIFDMKNCREIDIYIIKITFKQAHSFNIF